MAVSGRRRYDDDDKVVRYLTAENDFEVEVTRTLNKWCVTVYQLPDRDILAQDFFPERWKALARAQDFIRLVNQRNKGKQEQEQEHEIELGPAAALTASTGGALESLIRDMVACVPARVRGSHGLPDRDRREEGRADAVVLVPAGGTPGA